MEPGAMSRRVKPVVPDTVIRFRDKSYRGKKPPFELSAHPQADPPKLTELLPAGSHVPAPFEPTKYRRCSNFSTTTSYIDRSALTGEAAVAIYSPGGEFGEQSVQVACQITRLPTEDQTTETVAAHHKEKLWKQCHGDPDREIYSSWVTTTRETETAYGFPRTSYRVRRPRLTVATLDTDVHRPVSERAIVIQSTEWGLIGTGAFLTPSPDNKEALNLARTVADTVTGQAVECQPPAQCNGGVE